MGAPTPPWQTPQAFAFAAVANTFGYDWTNNCGRFCANAYGFGGSGYLTAALQGQASKLHSGAAPLGALHFWGGGSGHVAIEAGGGNIWSNDLKTYGRIDLVPFAWVASKWGKPYMGWALPTLSDTFMQAWGTNLFGYVPPSVSPATAYFADEELF